jgi:hypothetical protein
VDKIKESNDHIKAAPFMKNHIDPQRLIMPPMYEETMQVGDSYSYEVSTTQNETTNDKPIVIISKVSQIKAIWKANYGLTKPELD